MTAWRKDRNGWLVLVFQFPDPRRPGHNVRVRHALNLRSSTDNDKIAERVKREVEALRALGRFDEIVAKFPTCRVFRKLGLLPEPVAQKPTLGALCTEWLEQKRTHGRSNATIATYAYLLKRVLSDALAAKRCDLVTAGDIEGLIERLRGRVAELADAADLKSAAERRAGSTPAVPTIPAGQINRIVWILSSAYAMGEKRHELTRNPARLVERMDAQHKRPTDPFSADEVKKILEAANDTKIRSSSTQIDGGESRFRDSAERIRRDCPPIGGKVGTSQSYNLVIVAIGTGMRVGELFGLKWPAINFDGNYIDVSEVAA